MDLLDGGLVGGWGDNSRGCASVGVMAVEGWGEEGGPQRGFGTSGAGVGDGDAMGWVAGLESSGKELLAEKAEMVVDGKDLGFFVQVGDGGPLGAACGYSEGRVLHPLKFLDVGGGGVGEPDWSGVVEDGAD